MVKTMRADGGKTVYGAAVGILMLDTRFPRIPGDIGHAATWPFPVLYRVVRDASPDQVVRRRAAGLLPAFIAAARDLVADGADGITTNCGFLALIQRQLAEAVGVPVAASSLMQVPLVQALLPPGQVPGIITISSDTLSADHLSACGVALDTPTVGTEDGLEFSRAILNDEPVMDVALAREDVLNAGRRLLEHDSRVGAVVLECTNMTPYAADLRAELGLPVFGIYSFVQWFQAGLLPRAFAGAIGDPRPARPNAGPPA
jgi:Asp/Glu/hydantoin racemase